MVIRFIKKRQQPGLEVVGVIAQILDVDIKELIKST
jgi:hypothetical protein